MCSIDGKIIRLDRILQMKALHFIFLMTFAWGKEIALRERDFVWDIQVFNLKDSSCSGEAA